MKRNRSPSILIDEEIDLYGFSLIGSIEDKQSNEESEGNNGSLLHLFKVDENWNNPESVNLMMRAYGIEQPYDNHVYKVKTDDFSYLTIRDEQRRHFSYRFRVNAKRQLESGKYSDSLQSITESLRYDPKSIESLLFRIEIYDKLRMVVEAINDCREILKIDADNATAIEYLSRRNISVHPLSSRSSFIAPFNPQNGFSATIDKIRLSIQENHSKESLSAGDNNDDKGHSNNIDSQSGIVSISDDTSEGSEKKKGKKKKKKHKKSKSSKHDSKHKKHKKKEKDKKSSPRHSETSN